MFCRAVRKSSRLCIWKMKPMCRRTSGNAGGDTRVQLSAKHNEFPGLDGAKAADERQKRRLATPGWACQECNLTRPDIQVEVEEHLFGPAPLVVGKVEPSNGDGWTSQS